MTENWITIILSSAIVSVIISGLTTYFIEKRKYSQEYWKITIDKRLEAYEEIEKLLIFFQTTHLVNDNPCHLAFLNIDKFDDLQEQLGIISWKRSWISSKLYKKIIKLNRVLIEFDSLETNDISNFGVKNYSKIADIRDVIIKIIAEDYLNMPKVKSFFKSKIKE